MKKFYEDGPGSGRIIIIVKLWSYYYYYYYKNIYKSKNLPPPRTGCWYAYLYGARRLRRRAAGALREALAVPPELSNALSNSS